MPICRSLTIPSPWSIIPNLSNSDWTATRSHAHCGSPAIQLIQLYCLRQILQFILFLRA